MGEAWLRVHTVMLAEAFETLASLMTCKLIEGGQCDTVQDINSPKSLFGWLNVLWYILLARLPLYSSYPAHMSGYRDSSMYNARQDQSSPYKHCWTEISSFDDVINCYVLLSCDEDDVVSLHLQNITCASLFANSIDAKTVYTCCTYRFGSHTIGLYIVRWMMRQAWPRTALSHEHGGKVRRHRARTPRRCRIPPDHCFGFQWVVKKDM